MTGSTEYILKNMFFLNYYIKALMENIKNYFLIKHIIYIEKSKYIMHGLKNNEK